MDSANRICLARMHHSTGYRPSYGVDPTLQVGELTVLTDEIAYQDVSATRLHFLSKYRL